MAVQHRNINKIIIKEKKKKKPKKVKVMATVNHIFPWRDMSCYIIIPVPQEKKKLHGPDLDRFSMRNSRRARAHTYKLLWSRFHLFFYSPLSLSLPPRYKGLIFPESSTISSVSHLYFRRLSICFLLCKFGMVPLLYWFDDRSLDERWHLFEFFVVFLYCRRRGNAFPGKSNNTHAPALFLHLRPINRAAI